MQDAPGPGCGEEDGQQIVEASRREGGRNFKRILRVDGHTLVEEAVAAHSVSVEAGYIVRNLEGAPVPLPRPMVIRRPGPYLSCRNGLLRSSRATIARPRASTGRCTKRV